MYYNGRQNFSILALLPKYVLKQQYTDERQDFIFNVASWSEKKKTEKSFSPDQVIFCVCFYFPVNSLFSAQINIFHI